MRFRRAQAHVGGGHLRRMASRLAAAGLIAVVLVVPMAPPTVRTPVRPAAAFRPTGPAVEQVSAQDGRFWVGSNPIELIGINFNAHPAPSEADLQRVASWEMNFVRLDVQWLDLEPDPPVWDGSRWVHTYDQRVLNNLRTAITRATASGLYVLVESSGCGACSLFGWPDWLYDEPYNSKGVTYPRTEEGALQAAGDFWSDARRQQFMQDMLEYLVVQVRDLPGIIGYEVLNEPNKGYLEPVHATTRLILDYQLRLARAVRALDPERVIFFLTRGGSSVGIEVADLSGFVALGNVALDHHDYFGARWGDGHGGEVPAREDYQERIQSLFNHVLNEEEEAETLSFNYLGTTHGQMRYLEHVRDAVARWGIPLLVAEFGDPIGDPGVHAFYGTVTSALNALDLSWAATAYRGPNGIVAVDGTLYPWASIVIEAARAAH